MGVSWQFIYDPKVHLGVAAFLLGIATWVLLTRALRFWSVRRINRLDKVDEIDYIASELPDPLSPENSIKKAKDAVRTQYQNTRRLLLPILVVVTLVLAALPFLPKIPAALMSVYLGAGSLLVGMAAKPMVENFFAGLVMGFSKTLNIGDTVLVHGRYATVEDINMTHTTLKLWDWRRYVVPNSKMMGTEFLNYSVVDEFIWAYVEFWVSYDTDLEMVKRAGAEAAKSSKYFGGWSEPEFWVMETNKEGVVCWLAAWANSPADAWYLKADIRAGLVMAFQENQLSPHCYNFRSGEPKVAV